MGNRDGAVIWESDRGGFCRSVKEKRRDFSDLMTPLLVRPKSLPCRKSLTDP